MTRTYNSGPEGQRVRTVAGVRQWTGFGLIVYTMLTAVLWAWPKGEGGPVWLLCLVPGLAFVLVVRSLFGRKTVHVSQTTRVIRWSMLLAVLWFSGVFFMGSDNTGSWALALPWAALTMLWPVVMALGVLARFIARKLLPGAVQKDAIDRERRAEQDSIARRRQQEIDYERRLQRELNSQLRPTAPGRFTSLEPAELATVEVPELPILFGTPGAGLSGSGFGAEQVGKGQAGEVNFARALQHAGQLERFATFWSVHMPDEEVGASATFSSDIDCVIVTGRSVYLLDMKNYTQGDVTWLMEDGALRLIDNPSGGYIGKARPMSRNMELAASRIHQRTRGLGVGHRVLAKVVFMPTEQGIGTIAPGVAWPGNVPAETLDQTLVELAAEPAFEPDHPDSEHLVRVFRWLVKDDSGSAPRLGEAWKRAPGLQRSGADAAPPSPEQAPTSRAAPRPAPAAGSAPQRGPVSGADPARTCEECGADFQPDWTFCWGCGRA